LLSRLKDCFVGRLDEIFDLRPQRVQAPGKTIMDGRNVVETNDEE
jgi:hypothetical protein